MGGEWCRVGAGARKWHDEGYLRTCDVKATENSRMTPPTTDSASCDQKLSQP